MSKPEVTNQAKNERLNQMIKSDPKSLNLLIFNFFTPDPAVAGELVENQ